MLLSAKIAIAIENVLKPLVNPGGPYAGKIKVIIRLQVQPWHGSSTFTHEAALAVRSIHDNFATLMRFRLSMSLQNISGSFPWRSVSWLLGLDWLVH